MHRRAFLATTLVTIAAPRSALGVTPVAAPVNATRHFEAIDPSPADPETIVARVDRLAAGSPPFPVRMTEESSSS